MSSAYTWGPCVGDASLLMQLADTPDTDYCFIFFLDTPLVRLSIDGLTIAIFVKNNNAPLLKNDLSFLCSNFVTINEIINEILKIESDFALEVWVSICYVQWEFSSAVKISFWYLLVLYVNWFVKHLKVAPKLSISCFQPNLAAIFVTIATVKVELIRDFYTLG